MEKQIEQRNEESQLEEKLKFAESRLGEYLNVLDVLNKRTGCQDTSLQLLKEIAKDMRVKEMKAQRLSMDRSDIPIKATQKQIEFLNRLNVDFNEGITKQKASELIEIALAKERDK